MRWRSRMVERCCERWSVDVADLEGSMAHGVCITGQIPRNARLPCLLEAHIAAIHHASEVASDNSTTHKALHKTRISQTVMLAHARSLGPYSNINTAPPHAKAPLGSPESSPASPNPHSPPTRNVESQPPHSNPARSPRAPASPNPKQTSKKRIQIYQAII